jgi:hypothetical protein
MYSPMISDVQSPSLARLAAFPYPPAGVGLPGDSGASSYSRVIAIGLPGDGSDVAANGAALRSALESVCAGPYTRCLLTLAAGVYELGAAPLNMRAYVDIEGAGELRTRLVSRVSLPGCGTVVGADHAELRCLSVANEGGGECAVAIYNNAVAPRLTYVNAEVSGGLANYGIYNTNGAAPNMTHVSVIASGRRCNIGVYNDAAAPELRHVISTAAGGKLGYGIYNCNGAAPVMAHVLAMAAGGERNVGVFNDQGCAPNMAGVTARALGGASCADVAAG